MLRVGEDGPRQSRPGGNQSSSSAKRSRRTALASEASVTASPTACIWAATSSACSDGRDGRERRRRDQPAGLRGFRGDLVRDRLGDERLVVHLLETLDEARDAAERDLGRGLVRLEAAARRRVIAVHRCQYNRQYLVKNNR